MLVIEGLIINVVGNDAVDVKVETIGDGCPRDKILRIAIGGSVPRPLGRQYTIDFLRKHCLGKRVHCIARKNDSDNQIEAIKFSLM